MEIKNYPVEDTIKKMKNQIINRPQTERKYLPQCTLGNKFESKIYLKFNYKKQLIWS